MQYLIQELQVPNLCKYFLFLSFVMKFLFNLTTYNRARSVAKFQLFGVLVSSRSYCNNCLGESSHREVLRRTGVNFWGGAELKLPEKFCSITMLMILPTVNILPPIFTYFIIYLRNKKKISL